MAVDFYAVLGVPRDADTDQIKRAYRKLAMEYHPDRNREPGAEERFKEVTEAYEVLREPEKRQLYDRYGEAGLKRGAGAGGPFGGFGNFAFADAFEVFMREFGAGGFGDIFGQRPGAAEPRRGSAIKIPLDVSLAEAAAGVERTIRVAVLDPCDACNGTGAARGTSPVTCSNCGGAGEVRHVQRSVLGQFVSVRPCPDCRGQGIVVEQPCERCRGATRIRNEKQIKIEVPAGVSSEDLLKLRDKGNTGPQGGPRGDILVQIEVTADDRFERRGDDLILDISITFSQAALGAELSVPTINGTATLTIPSGIQSGQLLRMRGRGMPRLRGSGNGDQLVRVLVWTPSDLTREQRELLEQLAEHEQEPPEPRRDEPGFWERVKAAFTA